MNPHILMLGLSILSTVILAFVLYRLRMARLCAEMSAHFELLLRENTLPQQKRCEELLQHIEGSRTIAEKALSSDTDPEHIRRALGEIYGLLAQAITR